MNAWRAMLGSAHMQPALVELDLMPLEAATEPAARSAAAERMRRHRQRRRDGLRCLMIELRETEVDALLAQMLCR